MKKTILPILPQTQFSFQTSGKTKVNFIEKNKALIRVIEKRLPSPDMGSYINKKLISPNSKKRVTLSSSERYNNFLRFYRSNLLKEKNKKSLTEEINFSKQIIKEEPDSEKTYNYKIISQGNASEPVKDCFAHRKNWKICDSFQEANFIWAPLSTQIDFSEFEYNKKNNGPKLFNHFEYHTEISNKQKMFKNLMVYCEENSMDVFKYVPLTIYIEYESSAFLNQFKSFSYIFKNISDLVEGKRENWPKYRSYFYVESDSETKIGRKTSLYIPKNHYDGQNMWLLKAMNLNRGRAIKIINSLEECEKYIKIFYQGNIYKNIRDSQKKRDQENIDYNKKIFFELPKILNTCSNTSPKNRKEKYVKEQAKSDILSSLYRKIDYYTLLKKQHKEDKKCYQSNKILLQKYIEKPLLYKGRKFDVRMWVLLTHKMEVYIFKEGHLKATSFQYNLASPDSFVHLTNYSVQKYSSEFAKFEAGNEISFKQFEDSLKEERGEEINFRRDIYNKICDVIWLSLKSVKKNINPNGRKGSFEIFGYDLMIDKDLNPYLIEVNTNPGLEISSPLISILVPRMLDDALRLTVDKVFGARYEKERMCGGRYQSPYHVDGYSDYDIMYSYMGDLN